MAARSRVYVGRLQFVPWSKAWPYMQACPLLIDAGTDVEILHAFAASLGLQRCWFQVSDNGVPFYRLTAANRAKAIRFGAKEAKPARVCEIRDRWLELKNLADESAE